jgi:hypothetical protein
MDCFDVDWEFTREFIPRQHYIRGSMSLRPIVSMFSLSFLSFSLSLSPYETQSVMCPRRVLDKLLLSFKKVARALTL